MTKCRCVSRIPRPIYNNRMGWWECLRCGKLLPAEDMVEEYLEAETEHMRNRETVSE